MDKIGLTNFIFELTKNSLTINKDLIKFRKFYRTVSKK